MSDSATTQREWPRAGAAPAANATWRELRARATVGYGPAWYFARRFADGKLSWDPVFRALLESGAIAPHARVLDIGCGQALLACLLNACDGLSSKRPWPRAWAAAPLGTRYTGIELMPRDVARAQRAMACAGGTSLGPQVVCADMRTAALPPADVVVMLDVLHYIERGAQADLLKRVHAALCADGRLLLRVGDAADRWRYAFSQCVDRVVTHVRGHRSEMTHGRTLVEWIGLLRATGFEVEVRPMSRGTPFANMLLVCSRRERATA